MDYTRAESINLQVNSAKKSREINIDETFESLSKTNTTFHFKKSAWTRHSIKAVNVGKLFDPTPQTVGNQEEKRGFPSPHLVPPPFYQV